MLFWNDSFGRLLYSEQSGRPQCFDTRVTSSRKQLRQWVKYNTEIIFTTRQLQRNKFKHSSYTVAAFFEFAPLLTSAHFAISFPLVSSPRPTNHTLSVYRSTLEIPSAKSRSVDSRYIISFTGAAGHSEGIEGRRSGGKASEMGEDETKRDGERERDWSIIKTV